MAWAASEPLKVEEVEVAPPQKGEVRVKVIANALVGVMNEKKYTLFFVACAFFVASYIHKALSSCSTAPFSYWYRGARIILFAFFHRGAFLIVACVVTTG